jgi:hypothetical protein
MISQLDNPNVDWIRNFRAEWEGLEEANAYMLDPESLDMGEAYPNVIKGALTKMKFLIVSY